MSLEPGSTIPEHMCIKIMENSNRQPNSQKHKNRRLAGSRMDSSVAFPTPPQRCYTSNKVARLYLRDSEKEICAGETQLDVKIAKMMLGNVVLEARRKRRCFLESSFSKNMLLGSVKIEHVSFLILAIANRPRSWPSPATGREGDRLEATSWAWAPGGPEAHATCLQAPHLEGDSGAPLRLLFAR